MRSAGMAWLCDAEEAYRCGAGRVCAKFFDRIGVKGAVL